LLYLLNKDVRTVRWNGEPLHEASSAIVKETMNGDFTLTVKYPISDSGIYQLIQEDMLIKAPTPVLGAQLFRIKKPVEHNDHLEITAYHISDDVMQRSITPMSVTSQSCGMALSHMVQNTKTALGDFSFNSDIQDRRTFNTTETETLYSVLLDGKHSIVGTWEGELVRDNFAMTVKKSRGENRGVVITTHKNLKDYQRTKNSQNVVTRIHAKSTFKPEGAEKETTIRVTVDSPLINSYPYINEKEYENNNAKSVEELQKWAQAKFSNEGIDKVSDAIKIEAYELDGQVVHMGDTVNLKSWKHNVDSFKKAIAYEFDALKEEYISLTFDDKAGTGGSRASGGLSSAADAILGVTESAQEVAIEKALQNADLDFDHKAGLLRQEISDGIELAKARAEEVKRELSDTIDQRFNSFNNGPLQEAKRRAEEALRNAGASTLLAQEAKRIGLDSIARLEAFKSQATSAQTALSGDLDVLKRTVTSEVNQASEYRRTTTEALSRMTGQMDGFATKSEVKQGIDGLTQTFAKMKVGGRNLWIKSKTVGAVIEKLPENHVTGQKECYRLENNSTLTFNIEPDFSSRLHQKVTFSAWIKYENVVQGQNFWNVFNCFKHYLFRKNSKTGVQSSPDYTTLGMYKGSSDWKYITFTYDYSENQNFDQLKTSLRFNLEGATSGTAWVTGIKVEIGSVATDWSPAPEDGENELLVAKTEFKKTADGLSTKMAAVESYVGQDDQRQEALRRYTREESARQATAVRELVTRDYVGKASHQEDVRAIERKFEAITNPQNGSIATQIATYRNAVDGRFTEITSMISGKASQADFQKVKETSQLYERILGNTDNGIANNVARMALTNQLFQVEVAKAAKGGRNYIRGIKEMRVASGSWDSGTFRGSGSGSVRTIEVLNSPVSGFNKAVRIISSDPKGQIGVAQDGFEIMPGTYTMSVWIKGSAGQRVRLQNYWWSDDSTGISPEFILKDDKWTYLTFSSERKKAGKLSIGYVYLVNGAKGSYLDILAPQLEEGSIATSARPALEDTDEAIRSVQSQLAGSFAFQNLTSAGSIVSQINATNNQILIEAEKIRLKGKTLLDELTAIQGYFKRLFVGEGAFAKLNAEIIASKTITADKLVMDMAMVRMFVSSDIFTDTLAAKEAFINKLRSVVVTATLLEGFKGRIGGFQIGTHEKDSSVYWITGQNQFSVGMSNGSGQWSQTALWVNWGNNWGYPGDYAWFVKHTGQMYCYNRAEFWNTPIIHGDLKVTGHIFYNNENSGKSGYWIHSSKYSNFEPSNNYLYLYYSGSGYDWIPMNKEISDRRYKSNIEASTVSGLDVVESLKTYSYRKEYDGKIEDIACGIMAQDVQKYAPEAFYENPDGAYSYNTFALVPYLIKAIQELNQKIEKLEKTA
jgi:phage minor structural protein